MRGMLKRAVHCIFIVIMGIHSNNKMLSDNEDNMNTNDNKSDEINNVLGDDNKVFKNIIMILQEVIN